jgi:GntR family transcriptional regulator
VTDSQSIYEDLRGSIVAGRLGSGERLPTVRQVAADLGVAIGTAAKAYRQLEADGLVVTRTGAGTHVAESAALLPGAIVIQIRELARAANELGLRHDDVLSVVRGALQD